MFLAIVPHYYMSCFLPKNADHLKKKNNKNAQKSSKKKIDITQKKITDLLLLISISMTRHLPF